VSAYELFELGGKGLLCVGASLALIGLIFVILTPYKALGKLGLYGALFVALCWLGVHFATGAMR
jgi:hypothetical protein